MLATIVTRRTLRARVVAIASPSLSVTADPRFVERCQSRIGPQGAVWSGWPRMGGRSGFGEPATGMSFDFLPMSDLDQTRQFVRGIQMSDLALAVGR